ncbi:maleylpyruvate isomerase family mycothiol-dependent enzyme [Kibdelosporangium persicum]|uniref:Maleylpyruvate isomerase family mycothiol-dependent enzyme n=1 Tax=Kibdelosporangium persicum TaxID=2698649 RepID=A0ABX2F7K8_9PSEU|nr:maleylpyruvate isomerase family mycothiol-dependent enzyme [Kibdelosporangium persicum]NRN67343.1 Maleylpyruvate isomerase family mycothiol-dependent enzyme [Kibdelosporangium persicum]
MHIDWLRDQTGAVADAVTGLDPDRRVPTCPEWSVRELVAHVGLIQRRAAKIVRTGEAVPFPRYAEPPADWAGWLREGAAELADAAIEAGAKEVWTFFGDRRPTAFWVRRMLHDTTIHAVDAALTAAKPYRIPAALAKDGIDEGLDLVGRMRGAELRGDGETLRMVSPEGDGWLITREPDGPLWKRTVTESADVTVTGTVQDLLLLLYRRIGLDGVTVTGDRDLITHWLAHSAL